MSEEDQCTQWYWTGERRVQCVLRKAHQGEFHLSEGYTWKDCPESVCGHVCIMHEGHLADHIDASGERWSRVFVANNSADFYRSRAVPETLVALQNSGVDLSCGACMSIAFSGSTTSPHTCVKPPIPLELYCPMCGRKHVDTGEFATKPHHTHSCQNLGCGHTWRPAVQPTVGVACLPGFVSDRTEADEAVMLLAFRVRHELSVPYRDHDDSVEKVKELLSKYLPAGT